MPCLDHACGRQAECRRSAHASTGDTLYTCCGVGDMTVSLMLRVGAHAGSSPLRTDPDRVGPVEPRGCSDARMVALATPGCEWRGDSIHAAPRSRRARAAPKPKTAQTACLKRRSLLVAGPGGRGASGGSNRARAACTQDGTKDEARPLRSPKTRRRLHRSGVVGPWGRARCVRAGRTRREEPAPRAG